jgi:hypothetical protein
VNAIILIAAVLQVLVALVFLGPALRSAKAVMRIVRLPTTPIAKLREGPAEVSGKVTVTGEPIYNLRGQRCIVLETTISNCTDHSTSSQTKQPANQLEKTHKQVGTGCVVDSSGRSELDLRLCQFIGERWKAEGVHAASVLDVAWARELLSVDAHYINIEEHFILEGSTVLLNGEASLVSVDPNLIGYRSDANAECWSLAGTPEALLVMSQGSQTRLLLGAAAKLLGVALVIAYLFGLGLMSFAYVLEI